MRFPQLPAILRDAGLEVVIIGGADTRGGEMLGLRGLMWHHTGTPASAPGDYPSLRVVRDGRSDLPGPLAQLGLSRSGVWYYIASGLANHAGKGYVEWCGRDNGNQWMIGVEAEHPGTSGTPWPVAQLDSYRRGTAAILKHFNFGADRLIGHKEWAPTRKVDPINLNMNVERQIVAQLMNPQKVDDEMAVIPYSYPPCPKDVNGNVIEVCHTFCVPVGDMSSLVDRAWINFKCSNGPALRVHMMAIASTVLGVNDPYHDGGAYEQTFWNVPKDAVRKQISAGGKGCKVDQFVVYVKCENPYTISIETLPKG